MLSKTLLVSLRTLVVTLALGALGAWLGWALGLPAPFLTGPAALVSAASLSGLKLAVPVRLRDAAFILIGIGLGTGITPEVLERAAAWPVSLICLAVAIVVLFRGTAEVLHRLFGMERQTALLSSAPGHLSFVLSLSVDTGGDTARVALIQSLRVLALTLLVPLIVSLGSDADMSLTAPPAATLWLPHIAGLMALALGVGVVFKRWAVPAAYLMGGMAVSLAGHVLALTPGQLPLWLTIPAYALMGTLIGTRFSGVTWRMVVEALGAAGVVIGMAKVISLVAAEIVAPVIGLPVLHVLVAFAPGGLETMAALAIILGVDPAYVALHHVARLLFLSVLVPVLLKRAMR